MTALAEATDTADLVPPPDGALRERVEQHLPQLTALYLAYQELGGTYFTQRDPERATHRAITALNQLGYTVTLNPIEGAA